MSGSLTPSRSSQLDNRYLSGNGNNWVDCGICRRIKPAIIASFGNLLDHKLRGPDPKIRREYIYLLVGRVEGGDREIRITGRNTMLERAVVASQTPGAVMPKAERKWRARQDSNYLLVVKLPG